VFNNHHPVDPTILNKISQRSVLPKLDWSISFKKVDAAINKLKNDKALGLNGIPPKAYKAINSCMHCRIHPYRAAFFEGDTDYAGWHQSQCVPSNPNK
jgi:hypothetical protein